MRDYPDDIMLCFVQGFESDHKDKNEKSECDDSETILRRKRYNRQVSGGSEVSAEETERLVSGKSLRLSTGAKTLRIPEVKRSFSDRFSVITDASGKKSSKGLLTVRKTWSTGNFASSAMGGGGGAPRSAPATPLQLEPHPSRSKHDKHTIKPFSGSAPSVRVGALAPAGDTAEGTKQPSKSRQKKFMRHFPQVGPEEKVLNYYSCALVGDLLLQGYLYITKNYFAFYSNVFGYVTKLLIPTTSVLRITKEKVARIIPNAVGVCTRDERHVFGSLLSRDSTYKLMTHVWKAARVPELAIPKPQELRTSEVELVSEYSVEDDSSSGGGENRDAPTPVPRDKEAIITAGAAVIQPALLTGNSGPQRRVSQCWNMFLLCACVLLALSACVLATRLYLLRTQPQDDINDLSTEELFSEMVRWRAKLHGKAATELHSFLTANLVLITKVRQSLESLSGVILTDVDQPILNLDVPNETIS